MAEIEILRGMGLDFLSNEFQIVIPAIDELGVSVGQLNMRVTSVTIPDRTIETYEVWRRGRKLTRPNTKSAQDLTLSFTFRHDKYLQCYKSMLNWMNSIQNQNTMAIGSDSGPLGVGGESEFRHNVEVWAINNMDNPTPHSIWTFEGAFPTTLSGMELTEDGGDDALTCDVTMECLNIVYPS